MKKLLLFISISLCCDLKAQTWVTIPDANFASYLQGLIPSAMSGNQMDISSPLVTSTTHSINVYSINVTSLTGVQYFTSLTYLNCNFNTNYLTSLPALPSGLETLLCSTNSLSSLPALPNTLTSLDCSVNGISSLPVLPDSLQSLNCGVNMISSLPILPNTLTQFRCAYNSLITNIPNLPDSLKFFASENCSISCFPIFPNSITYFSIDPNPYTCLPNYISAMNSTDLAVPLCTTGNLHGCPTATDIEKARSVILSEKVYPIPASDKFIIETNSTEKQTVQLFDINGKLVLSQNINGTVSIDASNLDNGVYTVTIRNGSVVTNRKLVIAK